MCCGQSCGNSAKTTPGMSDVHALACRVLTSGDAVRFKDPGDHDVDIRVPGRHAVGKAAKDLHLDLALEVGEGLDGALPDPGGGGEFTVVKLCDHHFLSCASWVCVDAVVTLSHVCVVGPWMDVVCR
jgi:hypothetical protein